MKESEIRKIIRESAREKLIIESYVLMCDRINEETITDLPGAAASFLGDNIGGAFTASIKQYLIELLFRRLEGMGFPISDESIVGRALVNTIQKLEWTNLSKYFTDESACGEIADVLIGGVQEGLQEKGIDTIVATMFGVPGRRLTGPIGSPIRELINIKINEMTEGMRNPIKDFLCDHRDINKLVAGFKSGLGAGAANSDADVEDLSSIGRAKAINKRSSYDF